MSGIMPMWKLFRKALDDPQVMCSHCIAIENCLLKFLELLLLQVLFCNIFSWLDPNAGWFGVHRSNAALWASVPATGGDRLGAKPQLRSMCRPSRMFFHVVMLSGAPHTSSASLPHRLQPRRPIHCATTSMTSCAASISPT